MNPELDIALNLRPANQYIKQILTDLKIYTPEKQQHYSYQLLQLHPNTYKAAKLNKPDQLFIEQLIIQDYIKTLTTQ